jgi:hypothetical protein
MGYEDEDIIAGEYEILGESQRGLQDSEFVGAGSALKKLRGHLGQLAQTRSGRYAPMQRVLRSPFKDSTQIGLTQSVDMFIANNAGASLTAVTRVYKSFKPNKAVVTETIRFDWTSNVPGSLAFSTYVSPQTPNDILMVSAFSGADNCFPNAPSAAAGINCSTFSFQSLGVGISWPTLNGGIDMTVGFFVRPSIFSFATGTLPTQIATASSLVLVKANVTVDMTLLGPSLR